MKRTATNASSSNAGPYTTGSASLGAQQSYHSAGGVPPPRQQSAQGSGIPGYSSQIEGITVSEAVVNDVLVDLQSKMINETQQQYQDDSSSGNYFGKKIICFSFRNKNLFFRNNFTNLYSTSKSNYYSSIRSSTSSC